MKITTPRTSSKSRSNKNKTPTSRRPSQGSTRPQKALGKTLTPKSDVAARHEPTAPRILTIGHSTRPIADFLHLLEAHQVTCLVDVRTVPRSRHNPQFSREHLPASLHAAGISYLHRPELGGLRRPKPGSPNAGWRNLSFRGYADYMQTPEFNAAVDDLIELAKQDRLALMCAEAVPWRCHRSLVADALLVRGVETADISSATRLLPHRMTPFAKVRGTKITYPPEEASLPRHTTRVRSPASHL